MSRELLAQRNPQYRNRLIIGPNWRADIITEIERGAKNPNQISKKLNCSYESAHRVWNDYNAASK